MENFENLRGDIMIDRFQYEATVGLSTWWTSDGHFIQLELPPMEETHMSKVEHRLDSGEAHITTIYGDEIVFEVPSSSDEYSTKRRPVIYLDQNAWSKLTDSIYSPDKVQSDSDLEASRWLIHLAQDSKVILPYSSGHMVETTQWKDRERRYRLGITLLQLSRGWQMLDPLVIRNAEMKHVLSGENEQGGTGLPVAWTLEPNAVHRGRLPGQTGAEEVPADFRELYECVTTIAGTVDALLDSEPVPRSDPYRWADHWQKITEEVAREEYTKQQKEDIFFASVIMDASGELAKSAAEIGMNPVSFRNWLWESAKDAIKGMPAFGMFSQVMYLKLGDKRSKWPTNDLTDIFYLIQASGYADAVVGERHFTSLAEQAQRKLNRDVNVYRSIQALRESGRFAHL